MLTPSPLPRGVAPGIFQRDFSTSPFFFFFLGGKTPPFFPQILQWLVLSRFCPPSLMSARGLILPPSFFFFSSFFFSGMFPSYLSFWCKFRVSPAPCLGVFLFLLLSGASLFEKELLRCDFPCLLRLFFFWLWIRPFPPVSDWLAAVGTPPPPPPPLFTLGFLPNVPVVLLSFPFLCVCFEALLPGASVLSPLLFFGMIHPFSYEVFFPDFFIFPLPGYRSFPFPCFLVSGRKGSPSLILLLAARFSPGALVPIFFF